MNVEHRTSNIEHRIMCSVRFKKDFAKRFKAPETRNLTPETNGSDSFLIHTISEPELGINQSPRIKEYESHYILQDEWQWK